MTEIHARYGGWSLDRLLDHVYGLHEWFKLNSIRPRVVRPHRPRAEPGVYTTGYEGLSLDAFLNRLLRSGIECLVDVRSNPVARRYGFHKSTLERATEGVGLSYVHVPEVGVPSGWRQELDSPSSYAALFDRYRKEILPAQKAAVSRLATMVTERPSALMCKECDPANCHRTSLALAVAKVTGLEVHDLGEYKDALF